MILVIKDGKITGIDKTLLKVLDVDLHNLSELINKIELEIAALQNKEIDLLNKKLKVAKKDLLTLEDISVYEMFLVEETQEITPIQPIETEIKIEPEKTYISPEIEPIETEINIQEEIAPIKEEIKPIQEEIPPIEPIIEITQEEPKIEIEKPTIKQESIEEELANIKPEIEIPSIKTEEEKKPLQEQFEEAKEEIIPPIEEKKEEPIEISISFEDELSEVEKILAVSNKEAQEIIKNDLNQAKEELGIDDELANEFLEELYKQIEAEKSTFTKALSNSDYETIHKTAHKLKGAALNLRLSKLAYILKVIDEKSKQRTSIKTLKELIDKFYDFFNKIRGIKVKKPSSIPVEIQQLIKKTLQEYLETQNEKKFKKDKKYIEKLLNKKINSIEDLKNILKGNE